MADKLIHNRLFPCIYLPLLFLAACLVNVFEIEIYGAAFFLLVTAAMLVLSSDLVDAMLPALFLSVSVTKLYNLLANEVWRQQIIRVAWVILPLLAAIVFHFVRYRKRITIGPSFWGLCAISLALILGGVGTITADEYFAPGALFYTFGLGLGMVAFYLLVRSHMSETAGITVAKTLYLVGLYAGFCVAMFYVRDIITGEHVFLETHKFLNFQSSNNLSTFLMLAMPFPLYWAAKNPLHILSTVFMYTCVIFTGSRGGLLMGTVEFAILLVAYVVVFPRNRKQRIVAFSTTIVLGIALIVSLPFVARWSGVSGEGGETIHGLRDLVDKLKGYLLDKEQARYKLLERMVVDFKSNPVFGVGIGYTGNESIYNPVAGAMNWYHMWFAQVIGGLGILGILAYGFQLVDRVRIFLRNRTALTWTLLLSYVGLFLMSQVNPGEFCPVPYAALAMTFFAVMERGVLCKSATSDVLDTDTEAKPLNTPDPS